MDEEIFVEKQDFAIIKEKIIKTNELLLLFNKKNEKLGNATVAFKHLKSKYDNVLQELNRLKLDNERLSDTLERLKPAHEQTATELHKLKLDYAKLEECYQQHLIKSQLNTTELQEKINQCTCKNNLLLKSPTGRKTSNDIIRELKLKCSELKQEKHKLRSENDSLLKKNKKLEEKKINNTTLQKKVDCLQVELQKSKENQSSLQNTIESLQQKHMKEVNILREEISKLSIENKELFPLKAECRSLKNQIKEVGNRHIYKGDPTQMYKKVCVKSTQVQLDVCLNCTQTQPKNTIETKDNTRQDFSSQTVSVESTNIEKCHAFTQTDNFPNVNDLGNHIPQTFLAKQGEPTVETKNITKQDFSAQTEKENSIESTNSKKCHAFTQTESVSNVNLQENHIPQTDLAHQIEFSIPATSDMKMGHKTDEMDEDSSDVDLPLPDIFSEMVLPEIISPMSHLSRSAESPSPPPFVESITSLDHYLDKTVMPLNRLPNIIITPPTPNVENNSSSSGQFPVPANIPEVILVADYQNEQKFGGNLNTNLETVNNLNNHTDTFMNTQRQDDITLSGSVISKMKPPDDTPLTCNASKKYFIEKDNFSTRRSCIEAQPNNTPPVSSESYTSRRESSAPNLDVVEDQSVVINSMTDKEVADNSLDSQEKMELLFNEDGVCGKKSLLAMKILDNAMELSNKHEVTNVCPNIEEISKISEKIDHETNSDSLNKSALDPSSVISISHSANISLDNKEEKFAKGALQRRRKFWVPFDMNMFVKSRRNRPAKITKKYKTSSATSCNKKDTILDALRMLQQSNINFTISNSSLPLDDNCRYQARISSPLMSEVIIKPEKCKNIFSCKLDCFDKKCTKNNDFMMLRRVSDDEEPELLGFSSVKPELNASNLNRTAIQKPSNNSNIQDLVQQLLHGLKELTGSKHKRPMENKVKKSRNRMSEFNSETEPELERLFRKSADVLGRNRRLLAAAKGQSFESNGESFAESESEVMVDSGLVTATSKDTDSLTSFYSQNENEMETPIVQQSENANGTLLSNPEQRRAHHKSPLATSSKFLLKSFSDPMNVISPGDGSNKGSSNLRDSIDISPGYKTLFFPTVVSPLTSSTKSSPGETDKKEDTLSCFPPNSLQPSVEENMSSSFPVNMRLCQKISFDSSDNGSFFDFSDSVGENAGLVSVINSAKHEGKSAEHTASPLKTSNFNGLQNDINIENGKENGVFVPSAKLMSSSLDQVPSEFDSSLENQPDSDLNLDLSIKTSDLNCTLNDINISRLVESPIDIKWSNSEGDSDCVISPCANGNLKKEIVFPSTMNGKTRALKRKSNEGFNVSADETEGYPQRKTGRTKQSSNMTPRVTQKTVTLRSGTKGIKKPPALELRTGRSLTTCSSQQSCAENICIFENGRENACRTCLPSTYSKDEGKPIASESSLESKNITASNLSKDSSVEAVKSDSCSPTDSLRLKNSLKMNFEEFKSRYTLRQRKISQTQSYSAAAVPDFSGSLNRKITNNSTTESPTKLITIDRSKDDKRHLNEYSHEDLHPLGNENGKSEESNYEIFNTNVKRDIGMYNNSQENRIITQEIQIILKDLSGDKGKMESDIKKEIITHSKFSGHDSSTQNDNFSDHHKSDTVSKKQPSKSVLKQVTGTTCAHGSESCGSIRCGIQEQVVPCNTSVGKINVIQDIRLINGKPVTLLPVNKRKSAAPPAATYSRKRQILEEQTSSKNSDILSEVMQCMTRTKSKAPVANEPTYRGIDRPTNRINQERRVQEQDPFQECPKSPDTPEVPDRLPRLIPTEKPRKMESSKVAALMKKLMVFSSESLVLDEVIREFAFQDVDFMVEVIITKLSLDIHDKPDNTFAPIPPMTSTQRILLGFLTKLDRSTHPGILDKFLIAAEKMVLNKVTCELSILQPFTRLYTAVCRMRLDISRIRRFTCECFYFTGDFAVPILFTILTMWPNVLPMESETTMHPMGKVIVQLCYLKQCNQPGYNLLPLRDLLQKYYGYPAERWNCDEVFRDILTDYIRNPSVRLSDFTLLLFLKNKPARWVYQKVKENIIPLFHFIPDSNPNLKATLLILLGNIFALFNKYDEFEQSVISEMDNWFQSLLEVEKDSIVQRSLHLARTRLKRITKRKRAVKTTKNTQQTNENSIKQTEKQSTTEFNVADDLRLSESSLEANDLNNYVDSVNSVNTNKITNFWEDSDSSDSCWSNYEDDDQSKMKIDLEQGCDRVNSVENSESVSLISGQPSNVGVHLSLDKNDSRQSDYSDIEF